MTHMITLNKPRNQRNGSKYVLHADGLLIEVFFSWQQQIIKMAKVISSYNVLAIDL